MTFDLFADEPAQPQTVKIIAAPAPAPAAPGLKLEYLMEPCGLNRWMWRGVEIKCDMKLQGLKGHWSTVKPCGGSIIESDKRVELLKRIAEVQAKETS